MRKKEVVQKFFPEEKLNGFSMEKSPVFVEEMPLCAQAMLAWSLFTHTGKPQLWITDGPQALDRFAESLRAFSFGDESAIAFFPALEDTHQQNPEIIAERTRTLQRALDTDEPLIIATCIQALLQPVPSVSQLQAEIKKLRIGDELDLQEFAAWIDQTGYAFDAEIYRKGEAALRGGIIDIWPPTEEWPLRLEFFGDELDSIRSFNPADQQSVAKFNAIQIGPASDNPKTDAATFTDYLPADTLWLWNEPDSIGQHRTIFEESFREALIEFEPEATAHHIQINALKTEDALPCGFSKYDVKLGNELQIYEPAYAEQKRLDFVKECIAQARDGWKILFFFETDGSLNRFRELYRKHRGFGAIQLLHGTLCDSAIDEEQKLLVIAETDFYSYKTNRVIKRRGGKQYTGKRFATWSEIQPGELVVHVDHGIGKYLGLYEIEVAGRTSEVLTVEYAEGAKLYLPTHQSHLLTRYTGLGKVRPDLHKLGGTRWRKEKKNTADAIQDLAVNLLETQATRELKRGHKFSSDTPWQLEFEATFPWQETDDQIRSIEAVKKDMESKRPMDRLVCGDVGYGKTEVAMRAAFKAVMDGMQVAVLVPTTVLAQQHFDTFCERMAAFPVHIEMLSRFRTPAQQRKAVQKLKEGEVDIVIGTHRLVSKDVQFKNLGLVIIDEEQRFGVKAKERLKEMRQRVDVLTMTATPIPRTLYMSLTGAKDMSTIMTPPQNRQPVETIVTERKDETIRHAILRELNREGQIFYLHNRVSTIDKVWDELEELVPEASIDVAHGQMSEKELSEIMHNFMEGKTEILLCTTIIESGVDIPRANTIMIDRAERFGLSELYQLRGRVGRSNHKAYAYLMLPESGNLPEDARKRLQAMKQYSELGAGFKVAMRDLEIRGAGNLLGKQQSGHIAAIGFDLYCQLLQRTVAMLKGEKLPPIVDVTVRLDFLAMSPHDSGPKLDASDPWATGSTEPPEPAFIPYDYVEDETLRVQLYQRISGLNRPLLVRKLKKELRDRFGPIPAALKNLLAVAEIRIIAAEKGITTIEVTEGRVRLTRTPKPYITQLSERKSLRQLRELKKLLEELEA
ncbi:transcription-repair coupling factor [Verrucomicrobiota bacterium]